MKLIGLRRRNVRVLSETSGLILLAISSMWRIPFAPFADRRLKLLNIFSYFAHGQTGSGVPHLAKKFELVVAVLWSIWKGRNLFLFERRPRNFWSLASSAPP